MKIVFYTAILTVYIRMETDYQIGDINTVALNLVKSLENKVVLFKGEMGSGKTTLIKAMVSALGSSDQVSSPTFSIVNEYETLNNKIYHFDMYRIEDIEEALNFGFEEYLDLENSWLFIEWPDRIEDLLPENTSEIVITKNDNNSRSLKLSQNKLLTQKPTMQHSKTYN